MSIVRDHIVFVCTANICRSPIAEALLRHALAAEANPIKELKVVSAGISAVDGDAPSAYSVKSLQTVGLDLTKHKSQRLSQKMVSQAFAIFCMTRVHRLMIETQFKKLPKHMFLMRSFIAKNDDDAEIPDPYGLDIEDYEACRDNMVESIPAIIDFLKENYKPQVPAEK